MTDHRDVVIVGASLAGASCAIAARECGYDGSIALLGAEPHIPYSRPGLTKAVLRGEKTIDSTYVQPADWYSDHAVDLRTGCTVTRIDPRAHRVITDAGELTYGTLVLATGASPRHFDTAGKSSSRVSVIRTIDDCLALAPQLRPGQRLLVIGGGYIGVETAASALMLGCEVELVLNEPVLWQHMYGEMVGNYFQRRLREHGARLHTGDSVERLEDREQTVRATLKSGTVIEADWVVAGIGVTPNVSLARDCGLAVDDGVLVDEYLHASAPEIHAIGDIAQYDSVIHQRRLRIEHWDVARQQGRYVGERIAGKHDEPYRVTPHFFSGLGDWLFMRYVGPGSGEVVVRGSMDDDSFAAVYVRDGRLTACLTVDRDDDLEAVRELLGAPVDVDALRNPDTPISAVHSDTLR